MRVQDNSLAKDARVPDFGVGVGLAETIFSSVIDSCAVSEPVRMHILSQQVSSHATDVETEVLLQDGDHLRHLDGDTELGQHCVKAKEI